MGHRFGEAALRFGEEETGSRGLAEALRVTREDVVAAAARIAGAVLETPLVEARIDGRRWWLKCECSQTGGAFKLRGASNRLLQLDAAERARGVVAFSSGNHAQGVAIAAQRLGIAATILMPSDAPALKVAGTRAAGAEVVFFDRYHDDRVAMAAKLARKDNATVVPAFDDVHVVAGQGTVGLEVAAQLAALGEAPPTQFVVPCGGGGLASGVALACPDAAITVVEPEGWDDMAYSLAAGEIIPVPPGPPPTLCDALQTLHVSPITLAILRARNATALIATDAEVEDAMRWAWRTHRLMVEPGGAAALAAVLAGRVPHSDGAVIILSGGNVDPTLHARIVGGVQLEAVR